MKIKCIGGLADGYLAHVHEGYVMGDLVRVPAKITFELESFEESVAAFREGRAPESMIAHYFIYKICALKYYDNNGPRLNIPYLIPQNWHEMEALQHLFAAHHAS